MQIDEFVQNFTNHPVLFIGTGLSLRYLRNSYTWDALLEKITCSFKSPEDYLDLKFENKVDGRISYENLASVLEKEFNDYLKKNRSHKDFEKINDLFYAKAQKNIKVSRLKLYISDLLQNLEFCEERRDEIEELKKALKNVASIITTNYDRMIETIFSFEPLIGNNIFLSNPYGSVYKIHGCVSAPEAIIITKEDYQKFDQKYEVIRAQLLSLFVHHPIIFLGYGMGDNNIKKILRTIFNCVDNETNIAEEVRRNFLLVEYEEGSSNKEVVEHDIELEDAGTIRINKLKTDDFISLYQAITKLILPVSVPIIRRVEHIIHELRVKNGGIAVKIVNDLESLDNSDKILMIGSKNSIKYEPQSPADIIRNYFTILEEENVQLLETIDVIKINSEQYFPIFAFAKICPQIKKIPELKEQQVKKLTGYYTDISKKGTVSTKEYRTPNEVINDTNLCKSHREKQMLYSIMNGSMDLDEVKKYLLANSDKKSTFYRQILCAYDYKKYSE